MSRFSVLFSSSKGNCSYVRYGDAAVMIDAGNTAKQLCNIMSTNGVMPESIKAILITHEHGDHVEGLRVFSKKYNVRIYTNKETIDNLSNTYKPSEDLITFIEPNETYFLNGMKITPFLTPHDAARSMGYIIECPDGRRLGYATDIGCINDTLCEKLYGVDAAIIEANYDVDMLKRSDYPQKLKDRVLSDMGHLSNDVSARLAVKLVKNGTRRIILAHLSQSNNTPDLAKRRVKAELVKAGYRENIDYQLFVSRPIDGREFIF